MFGWLDADSWPARKAYRGDRDKHLPVAKDWERAEQMAGRAAAGNQFGPCDEVIWE